VAHGLQDVGIAEYVERTVDGLPRTLDGSRAEQEAVRPSSMESVSPPVLRATGNEPHRCPYIWLSPHGSKRWTFAPRSSDAFVRVHTTKGLPDQD
jgi:hypothetical protein